MKNRHQIRASWHDYNDGIYFVTICCADKFHYFGEIVNEEMILSKAGKIAQAVIDSINIHFHEVEVYNSVVMPNHIHMVLNIVGTRHGASASHIPNRGSLKPKRHEPGIEQDFHHNSRLAVVIGQFKSTVKRKTNELSIAFAWQSKFHDHIIRNQRAFDNIMNYIDTNIVNWKFDKFNKDRVDDADAPWRVPT